LAFNGVGFNEQEEENALSDEGADGGNAPHPTIIVLTARWGRVARVPKIHLLPSPARFKS